MSLFPVKIPSMGESISQAVVSKMLKKAGDIVGFQEEILELETDKVNQVICSPSAGKLHWQVHEGDTVTIGQIVAQIDPEAWQTLDAKSPGSESTQKIFPESILENKPKKEKNLSKKKTSTFEEINQHPDTLQSHIMSIDSSQVNQPLDVETEEKSGLVPLENDPAIVPSTFKRASAFSSSEPREKRSKLSLLKRTMASRLLQSQATTATLTTFNEIDMSEVMKCREQYKEEFLKRHGVKLSLMSFFTKAVVQALEKVPAVGARIEGEDWVQPLTYDIGVAVSTDRGLLVPILRSCEQLSLAEIEQALFDVVSRAREGKVTLQELTDGCFTISNAGVFGSLLSTPILNPPQSAILGMHKIEKRAVVIEGDQLAVRPMMYVALSYDHRVIDGKQAVSFLLDIKESIEEPERMLLDI